ncbi:MAG TPA: 1-deoxy-D-xylulose-5-phosphate reductoisomerase, partial [Nitrospirae bacterium]|nr:1-deoxy-D-xylulose-5-phosphate reductoisomerase [Nitrospirota bacterium]HEW81816.1 1-deoxy-D-xylulose-5-phosphate reductoisomerase [Nitrospirota bacterium]
MKTLSILGSTGSIGRNTLEVISNHHDKFRVMALAARNNIKLLAEQINAFKPEVVAVFNEESARDLRKDFPDLRILSGEEGLVEVATLDNVDMVVSAIVGSPGLVPTYEAVKAGKDIALATKEALVMAGKIIMSEAAKNNVKILPVDSEHSAIFQCLEDREMKDIKKIILTASGGAFLGKSVMELGDVT